MAGLPAIISVGLPRTLDSWIYGGKKSNFCMIIPGARAIFESKYLFFQGGGVEYGMCLLLTFYDSVYSCNASWVSKVVLGVEE